MAEARTRRVEAPEVRRAQILDAAKSRFRDAGFHATTMADIASAAGVSVGLLYRYFPGKEDVIRSIVEADLKAQLAAVEGALDAHPDDEDAALEAVMDGVGRLALDRDRTDLLLEIAAETARNPVLTRLANEAETRVIARLKDRFGAGLPADEVDTRMRIALGLFSNLGVEVYRLPGRREAAVRVTTEVVRSLLARHRRASGA